MTNAIDTEINILLSHLRDADPGVRRIALIKLVDLEEEKALPLLIDALGHDADAAVRMEAAALLEGWDDTTVVTALCSALTDPITDVRERAAHSLGELKNARAGTLLLDWVIHEDAFVRTAVWHALRELRLPEVVPQALNALDDSDAGVRREAVAVLGWLKHQPALPELARRLRDDDDAGVRRAAAGALGLGDDDCTLAALQMALHDPDWRVREEAANTLGKLRRQQAGAALLAALDDDYWQVRLQAARALGRLRYAAAVTTLTTLLNHAIGNLRKEVALALGEMADIPSAVSPARTALTVALDDPDPEVRKAVRIALAQLALSPDTRK